MLEGGGGVKNGLLNCSGPLFESGPLELDPHQLFSLHPQIFGTPIVSKKSAAKIFSVKVVMLALFGFFVCIAFNAPFYVWVIGFLCLMLDS